MVIFPVNQENTAMLDLKPIFQYRLISTHYTGENPAFLRQFHSQNSKTHMSYVGFLLKQVELERWRQPPMAFTSKPVDSEWAALGRFPQTSKKKKGVGETGLTSQRFPG